MFRLPLVLITMILFGSPSFACDEYILSEEQQKYFDTYLQATHEAPVGEVAFVDNTLVGKSGSVKLHNKIVKGENLPEIDYNMLVLPDKVKNEKKEKIKPGKNPRCSVTADFNGDRVKDFAGLYKYKEPQKRSNNWILDLVIMYSVDESIKHVIYPYTGQFVEVKKNGKPVKKLKTYLRLRGEEKGKGKVTVNLMPGKYFLQHPGIGVFRRGRPVATYYWDGNRFSELAMGVDD